MLTFHQSFLELCFLPPDKGECENYRTGDRYYYFNAEAGKCEPFIYRGCAGNANRFYSLQKCRSVCAERLSPHKIGNISAIQYLHQIVIAFRK